MMAYGRAPVRHARSVACVCCVWSVERYYCGTSHVSHMLSPPIPFPATQHLSCTIALAHIRIACASKWTRMFVVRTVHRSQVQGKCSFWLCVPWVASECVVNVSHALQTPKILKFDFDVVVFRVDYTRHTTHPHRRRERARVSSQRVRSSTNDTTICIYEHISSVTHALCNVHIYIYVSI